MDLFFVGSLARLRAEKESAWRGKGSNYSGARGSDARVRPASTPPSLPNILVTTSTSDATHSKKDTVSTKYEYGVFVPGATFAFDRLTSDRVRYLSKPQILSRPWSWSPVPSKPWCLAGLASQRWGWDTRTLCSSQLTSTVLD